MLKKRKNVLEEIAEDIQDDIEIVEKKAKREWKIFKSFSKRNEDKLLFAAFVVLVCGLFVVNVVYIVNRLPDKQKVFVNNTVISPQTIIASSQSAYNGAFEVSVNTVRESSDPDKAFAIASDETMLIVDLKITNKTNIKKQFIPASNLYVRSRDGEFYKPHPSSQIKTPLVFQDVEAGAQVEGEVAFAIPKILTNPLLYIDLGWGNYVPVVYDILK